MVVCRADRAKEFGSGPLPNLRGKKIAIPGKLTTAFLSLQLALGKAGRHAHGVEARTEARLTGQVLARVDEPAWRRVRTLLGEASDLGALLPVGQRGPWAAATSLVQTDAPRVFDLARRAAFETLPQVLPVLDDVMAATGLPDPHCVRDWQHALQLLAELDALAMM